MVTKLHIYIDEGFSGSVLAKILMVTKHWNDAAYRTACSVLAKILMVTKLPKMQ